MTRSQWIGVATGVVVVALVAFGLSQSDQSPSTPGPASSEAASANTEKHALRERPKPTPAEVEAQADPVDAKPEPSNVVPYHIGATALKGLEFQLVSESEKEELKIPPKLNGVIITSVDPRSAAAEAKLKKGDVIVKANFEKLQNESDLQELVGDRKFTAIVVYRDGSPMELVIHKPFQPSDAGSSTN